MLNLSSAPGGTEVTGESLIAPHLLPSGRVQAQGWIQWAAHRQSWPPPWAPFLHAFLLLMVESTAIAPSLAIRKLLLSFICHLYDWIVICCSVAQLCQALCNPMDCSMPGLPVLHHLPEFAQTHVYWVSDAIQPSHPLSSTSPPVFNLSQKYSNESALCIR